MQTERDLVESVLETLRGLPQAHAELGAWEQPSGRDRSYDARIDLHIGGDSVSLLVEAKRTVYPRDVREVLWQIRRYNDLAASESANEQRLPLIVAESISPGRKNCFARSRWATSIAGEVYSSPRAAPASTSKSLRRSR